MATMLSKSARKILAATSRDKILSVVANHLLKRPLVKLQSTMTAAQFETLKLTQPADHVLNVQLNRPKKLNAMNKQFFKDMTACFNQIGKDTEIRAVVLSGSGKHFTAGLDLLDYASVFMEMNEGKMDAARKSWRMKETIAEMQESFNVIEKCPQPVIAAIHSACIGGGIDMVTACDIRLCSADAWFQIKEVDIGLAADLGTLQRLPRVVGNESLLRELCYTARKMKSDEAKSLGLVSHIFPSQEDLVESAVSMASQIAEKSPVAVAGTKENLIYARDHSVEDGLKHVMTWNMGMLQTEDTMKAAQASMSKSKATFSKL